MVVLLTVHHRRRRAPLWSPEQSGRPERTIDPAGKSNCPVASNVRRRHQRHIFTRNKQGGETMRCGLTGIGSSRFSLTSDGPRIYHALSRRMHLFVMSEQKLKTGLIDTSPR